MRCVSHTGYIAHGIARVKQKEGARHQNNNKRVARYLEERNASTRRESPKQGLTSTEDLTIMLPEGCTYPLL